jgi:hypothetical protein
MATKPSTTVNWSALAAFLLALALGSAPIAASLATVNTEVAQ